MHNDYFPPQVYLGLTYFCNLKCKHCYVHKKTTRDIPKQKIKNLIKEMANLGVFKIVLTHGESLLRRDVFDIISFCYRLNIDTTLITNGILLDEKTAKELKKAKVSRVVISFDSLSKEYHNNLRGRRDCWDKAIIAMDNCKKNGLVFGLNITINESNYSNLEGIIKFSIEKGAKDIYFLTVRNQKYINKKLLENYSDIIFRLWELKKKYNKKINIAFHDPIAIPLLANKIKTSEFKKLFIGNLCQAGISWISIKPDGEVSLCNFLSTSFGNVYLEGLESVWKKIQSRKFPTLPNVCINCRYGDTCKGGCRAFAKKEGLADSRCNLLVK
ncbi:MAG: radical SAM protein [Candidatus Cloacimonetes bacterium]|nr:radical SAM protein [Candidatus Cloacimonadota bacterium]